MTAVERIKKEMAFPHWNDDQLYIFELCLKWIEEDKEEEKPEVQK